MLNNFDICINTRFIFGKGAEKQIGEILKKDGVCEGCEGFLESLGV